MNLRNVAVSRHSLLLLACLAGSLALVSGCGSSSEAKPSGAQASSSDGGSSGEQKEGSGGRGSGGESEAAVGGSAGASAGVGLVARCEDGAPVEEGKPNFRDASADWGLPDLGATGVRISVVDFDGDDYPDIIARAPGSTGDDFGGGVRTSWLLRNQGGKGFEDVTHSSGFRQKRGASVADTDGRGGEVLVFADVDNDGHLDAYSGLSVQPAGAAPQTSEIVLGAGSGAFKLGPEANALRRGPGSDVPQGAAFTDFDRDGLVDLWVVQNSLSNQPQQDRLYRNLGGGVFEDVTQSVGLITQPWNNLLSLNEGRSHTRGWGAAACDLDADGWPELLSSSYGRAPNHLHQYDPALGNWTSRGVESGYAFDALFDWTDNESARCYCQHHQELAECVGVPTSQLNCPNDSYAFRWTHGQDRELFRLGGNSAGVLCGDLTGDGLLDLVTLELAHWDVGSSSDRTELLVTSDDSGELVLSRPGNAVTGLGRKQSSASWDEGIMSGALFDFDNDGLLDVFLGDSDYAGTIGRLYRQTEPGKFAALTPADGIDHARAAGAAVGDFDRDGDLDLVVGHSLMRCESGHDCNSTGSLRLFENVVGQEGSFVQLRLVGKKGTNRSAIGARVQIKAKGKTQTFEVGGGHALGGAQNDLVVHAGLGDACSAEVSIRWPDKQLSTQTFEVVSGYRYEVNQGQEPTALELK